jgi:hypothetical protein
MTDAEKLERVRRVVERWENVSGPMEVTFVPRVFAEAIRNALGEKVNV